jgi:hypothetical protein
MTIPPPLAPGEPGGPNGASADHHDLDPLGMRARTVTAQPLPFREPARRGRGARIALSLIAIALGFGTGYVVFGTDLLRKGSSESRPAAQPQPPIATQPTAPPVNDTQPAEPTEPTAPPVNDTQPAAAADCTASIDTAPATARVLLDGKEIGVGSLDEVKVPCGKELSLKVEHAGYKTFERHFTAETGVPLRIDAALTRQEPAVSKKARLKIASDPDGAILTVDGKVIGRGSASVTIDIGDTVFVTATLKGYKGWSKKVYVKKKTQSVSAKLEAIE